MPEPLSGRERTKGTKEGNERTQTARLTLASGMMPPSLAWGFSTPTPWIPKTEFRDKIVQAFILLQNRFTGLIPILFNWKIGYHFEARLTQPSISGSATGSKLVKK
jgi:hypothetical protein